MQPEQLRAARAALNWSLERMAEASGVHRNTISNFETRRYNGEPEKLAAVKRALESAGVIFSDENGEAAGASLRRFRRGDLVRFRPQTRVRFDYNIAADDIGEVVDVEPHPPAMGPTYKIRVKFERALVPYVFRYEYELVQAAVDQAGLVQHPMLPPDPAAIIDEFCVICTSARNDYDLYRSLFESDPHNHGLFTSIAPLCFGDMRRIMVENLFLQFSKITDPAATGKKTNLTANYILEKINWPDSVAKKLREVNDRLNVFRQYIEPARSRRIAHVDLSAQVEQSENLGSFPKGADAQFLQDLQTFINIAYGHFHDGGHRPIAVAMSTDSHQLIRALEKAVVFDCCTKCDAGERAVAVLDYEDRA
jgi:transcriptional regulator with XRE-family HTH domain